MVRGTSTVTLCSYNVDDESENKMLITGSYGFPMPTVKLYNLQASCFRQLYTLLFFGVGMLFLIRQYLLQHQDSNLKPRHSLTSIFFCHRDKFNADALIMKCSAVRRKNVADTLMAKRILISTTSTQTSRCDFSFAS